MSQNEKTEERRFQLRLLEVQQGIDVFSSIIAVIASIFVALITTTLTLLTTLPNYISIGLSASVVGYEIGVAIFALVVSWFIAIQFRNKRIKGIEREFHINQPTKTKT